MKTTEACVALPLGESTNEAGFPTTTQHHRESWLGGRDGLDGLEQNKIVHRVSIA